MEQHLKEKLTVHSRVKGMGSGVTEATSVAITSFDLQTKVYRVLWVV
jgi:hypothetical protein